MKIKVDFVTNSSSTSWILLSSLIPAAGLTLGWAASQVGHASTGGAAAGSSVNMDALSGLSDGTGYETDTTPQEEHPPVSGGEGMILDGTAATDWLESRGLAVNIGDDKNPVYQLTQSFWNGFYSVTLSSSSGSGLQAVAGEWDPDNRDAPIGDIAIIVTEDGGKPPEPTPDPLPEQGPKPEPTPEPQPEQEPKPETTPEPLPEQGPKPEPTPEPQPEKEPNALDLLGEDLPGDHPEEAPPEQPREDADSKLGERGEWEQKLNDLLQNRTKDNPEKAERLNQLHRVFQLELLSEGGSPENIYVELKEGRVQIRSENPSGAEKPNVSASMSRNLFSDLLRGEKKVNAGSAGELIKSLQDFKYDDTVDDMLDILGADNTIKIAWDSKKLIDKLF